MCAKSRVASLAVLRRNERMGHGYVSPSDVHCGVIIGSIARRVGTMHIEMLNGYEEGITKSGMWKEECISIRTLKYVTKDDDGRREEKAIKMIQIKKSCKNGDAAMVS